MRGSINEGQATIIAQRVQTAGEVEVVAILAVMALGTANPGDVLEAMRRFPEVATLKRGDTHPKTGRKIERPLLVWTGPPPDASRVVPSDQLTAAARAMGIRPGETFTVQPRSAPSDLAEVEEVDDEVAEVLDELLTAHPGSLAEVEKVDDEDDEDDEDEED